MQRTPFDEARAEQFSSRMLGMLNDGFTALMVSVGNQTELFETLSGLPPSTGAEIARAAGLQERYVREWLGAMVTARIVDYDPASGHYALPVEHAAALTRAAGSGNLAVLVQWIACMAQVEGRVVECFRHGGGVPYSEYAGFHRIMKQHTGQVFEETLLERTLPLASGIIGQLREGIDVLDVGCGSGHAINLMARAFPQSRFVGYDFSEEGIAEGRAEARDWGLANARFEVQDVAAIPEAGRFDLITAFDAIHDQAKPRKVLSGIARALRPGGRFLMVDIGASSRLEENLDHPLGPFLYGISTLHCMTVSLALEGEGLGTVWGEQQARELLAEAGFAKVAVHQVPGDIINNFYVASRD